MIYDRIHRPPFKEDFYTHQNVSHITVQFIVSIKLPTAKREERTNIQRAEQIYKVNTSSHYKNGLPIGFKTGQGCVGLTRCDASASFQCVN